MSSDHGDPFAGPHGKYGSGPAHSGYYPISGTEDEIAAYTAARHQREVDWVKARYARELAARERMNAAEGLYEPTD